MSVNIAFQWFVRFCPGKASPCDFSDGNRGTIDPPAQQSRPTTVRVQGRPAREGKRKKHGRKRGEREGFPITGTFWSGIPFQTPLFSRPELVDGTLILRRSRIASLGNFSRWSHPLLKVIRWNIFRISMNMIGKLRSDRSSCHRLDRAGICFVRNSRREGKKQFDARYTFERRDKFFFGTKEIHLPLQLLSTKFRGEIGLGAFRLILSAWSETWRRCLELASYRFVRRELAGLDDGFDC